MAQLLLRKNIVLLFLWWKFSQKNMFYKCLFYKKTLKILWLTKVDTEAKFQGLQILQNKLFWFSIGKLRNIEFCSSKKNYFTCNSLKRDRAALVGLPTAALGPQDIPHRRTARPELAGARFRYINSLENFQFCLNLTGL